MSISVCFPSVNAFLNRCGSVVSNLNYSNDAYLLGMPFYENENVNTDFQFGTTPMLSGHFNYQPTNYSGCLVSKLLDQVCTDSSTKNFQPEKVDVLSQRTASMAYNFNNPESEKKSKFWRPFSPPPACREDRLVESAIPRRHSRINSRNTFFSIKPSNVKLGQTKTSVFKAVKKNAFACTQCPCRYLSGRQLNSHMRVHTGSKPFRCEYPNCFKTFARNEELTRHKRIHSGFKPHLCSECKKRFGRKDHLSKHLKTHLQTSEKKVHQCSFPGCGHRYTRSDALTRHKSTAHALKNKK